MKLRLLLLISLILTGCNASCVQPSAPAAETVSPGPEPATAATNTAPSSEALDQLSGRISKAQEYLLQLKTQNGELQQQVQALLLQVQTVRDLIINAPAQGEAVPTESATAQLNEVMEQLSRLAADLQPAASGTYRISSAYSAQGDWVVVRYDQISGESWLAQAGQWIPLEESNVLAAGDYEISVLRADQDKKGYVALRMDRLSGDSWWLNGKRWQRFAE
ncbi:hypothetical protein [Neptuniibacter sp. CAU 1671]|uniref:hypothetical protein n=1 Tax=Neptuniibacter sp. CAU 1671 TaxID=3032593 RepID=UPI0023DAFE06|nr:hypothetical protein [Neptuniibacter sp. CAU 1671]MDF2182778.1 hypothetical protein [Neptuniibacter sp. CAU 1671]